MYTCTCIPTGIPVQVCIHAPPVLPVSIWNKEEIHDCDLIKCGRAVKVARVELPFLETISLSEAWNVVEGKIIKFLILSR